MNTVEPPNKGHYEANDFVPCIERSPLSQRSTRISMGLKLKQVSSVERLSLSRRVPYWRFHCILCTVATARFSLLYEREINIVSYNFLQHLHTITVCGYQGPFVCVWHTKNFCDKVLL